MPELLLRPDRWRLRRPTTALQPEINLPVDVHGLVQIFTGLTIGLENKRFPGCAFGYPLAGWMR